MTSSSMWTGNQDKTIFHCEFSCLPITTVAAGNSHITKLNINKGSTTVSIISLQCSEVSESGARLHVVPSSHMHPGELELLST
ncbi:hypothetical protein XELAEV_18039481mg [Xenopus laevis]|uniref:Uncharacterized protein n=1 Tax=Xenopus laevis TaxID=8355 RepID=A0A974C7M5_XENLA|nr:hypothetical protein XELAEV_18039481mg [Xenopus laevis]